jgi:hypothetical protein
VETGEEIDDSLKWQEKIRFQYKGHLYGTTNGVAQQR